MKRKRNIEDLMLLLIMIWNRPDADDLIAQLMTFPLEKPFDETVAALSGD